MASQLENPALSNAWDEPCSDSHLVLISKWIPEWKEVAPFLELTSVDEVNIFEYCPRSTQVQRIKMLRTWREKHGKDATYKRLAEAFKDCDRQDLADKLSELITEENSSRSLSGMLVRVVTYLSHIIN